MISSVLRRRLADGHIKITSTTHYYVNIHWIVWKPSQRLLFCPSFSRENKLKPYNMYSNSAHWSSRPLQKNGPIPMGGCCSRSRVSNPLEFVQCCILIIAHIHCIHMHTLYIHTLYVPSGFKFRTKITAQRNIASVFSPHKRDAAPRGKTTS